MVRFSSITATNSGSALYLLHLGLLLVALTSDPRAAFSQVWQPVIDDSTYRNPIIWSDFSDPDICRAGDDFYMTSSSFNCVPALPILHSRDLVNWRIANYAVKRFPDGYFDVPQHGNGVWAPAMRHHDGWFYIFWGDPDRGIFMVRSQDPLGDWEAPVLLKKAYGNIDPCPLWDDDGKVYMVHAFANSRAGISHILQVQELDPRTLQAVSASRAIVVNGLPDNPTVEGPKLYKRNGYYYIFAPAGGVAAGWQMVYRSRSIWGPYEERRVLEQGNTSVNGPHQGGWVELDNGESWFVHFQELQPFGRIVHLQPLEWVNDWPVMGNVEPGETTGEPIESGRRPDLKPSPELSPQSSDEFNAAAYNLAWQWNANYRDHWYSLSEREGYLRLDAQYHPDRGSVFNLPHLIAQKVPGPNFEATVKMDLGGMVDSEIAGFGLMGLDYAFLRVRATSGQRILEYAECRDAHNGHSEEVVAQGPITGDELYLRLTMGRDGATLFSYSTDGTEFRDVVNRFRAREGRWIGARVALYNLSHRQTGMHGHVDIDWFRVK